MENWDDELKQKWHSLSVEEYNDLRDKLWKEWIPSDANSYGTIINHYPKINPYIKSAKNVGFSTKERGHFLGICEYGPEQLIRCFRFDDCEMSYIDFSLQCSDCPHFGKEINEYGKFYKKSDYAKELLFRVFNLEESEIVKYRREKEIRDKEWNEKWEIKQNKKNNLPSFVYFISNGQHVKIGVADRPKQRLKELQTGSSLPLEILKTIECKNHSDALSLESKYHKKYKSKNTCGEWFDILEEVCLIA